MSDPLAGSDTYDILAGTAEPIEVTLTRWSRLELHDLVQIPEWSSRVSKLLADAAREIERLKSVAGVVTGGPSFRTIKNSLTGGDPIAEPSSDQQMR